MMMTINGSMRIAAGTRSDPCASSFFVDCPRRDFLFIVFPALGGSGVVMDGVVALEGMGIANRFNGRAALCLPATLLELFVELFFGLVESLLSRQFASEGLRERLTYRYDNGA